VGGRLLGGARESRVDVAVPHALGSATILVLNLQRSGAAFKRPSQYSIGILGKIMLRYLPSSILRLVLLLSTRWPWLASRINAAIIDGSVNASRRRPHPWSTVHPYVSWTSLTDRSWSARHLPAAQLEHLPSEDQVAQFFAAPSAGQERCPKSTLLFPAFAQYLTDGFIRTVMPNESAGESDELRRKNTSNHQIDMCPLYGRTEKQTSALRESSNVMGRRGRLKSQIIGGEEFAPFLLDDDGATKSEFLALDPVLGIDRVPPSLRKNIFAFGGDRANTAPQVAMINTLFLREHNRLAGEIENANPEWDDERVFQVARNVVIVLFVKIVVEEYIRHIAPTPFALSATPTVAWLAPWNKPNWITVEFSLLYRWHSLIPAQVEWGEQSYPVEATFFNNDVLINGGLRQAFVCMSSQRATRLGASNTATPLLDFEVRAVRQARICEVDTYANYRRYMKLGEPQTFEEISSNPAVVAKLRELYDEPNQVEFYVGLFAEDTVKNSPLPELLLRFVAVDAFSQALTNPLLSEHVFNPSTFSVPGWAAIHETKCLKDILDRNSTHANDDVEFVGMTRPGWSHAWPASEVAQTLNEAVAITATPEGKKKAFGFALSTVGEVAGLLLWLYFTANGQGALGLFFLVGGEAIEWLLLARMIVTSRFSHPKREGRVRRGLVLTALISFSEAFLWLGWYYLIGPLGLVLATLMLAIAMHIKHDAEMAVFTGRTILASVWDRRDLTASILEAAGAGLWIALTGAGYPFVGAAILLVCISIEHILQFKTAGFLQREDP
jgi:Animal haem peroxidase